MGNGKTLPFPLHDSTSKAGFDLVHTNVWGQAPVLSRHGHKYFVTLIDDYNIVILRFIFSTLLLMPFIFFKIVMYIENKFTTTIKTLTSESRKGYTLNNPNVLVLTLHNRMG